MPIMDFYHRSNHDGSFETICTRCFATIGQSKQRAQLAQMEAEHLCPARAKRTAVRPSPPPFAAQPIFVPAPRGLDRFFPNPGRMNVPQTLLMLCTGIVCFYIFPSVVETELMKHVSAWIACIGLGDLAGCSFLSLVCGLKKTGIWLYLFLTGCEGSLYGFRILPRTLLIWIVDLVPTLTVVVLIVISSVRSARARA